MSLDFCVGLVADLRGADGTAVFEDFGLDGFSHAGIAYHYFDSDERPVTSDQLNGCDAVISMGQPYTPSSFEGVDRLMLIARAGVGYDMVDLKAATEADVMVTITPEATRRPVASATLAMMLGLCHRIRIKDRIVRENRWPDRFGHMGCELRDRIIGLIGLGQIAQEVARLLQPFDPARILATDPVVTNEQAAAIGVEKVDLDTLLQSSDFISIHCPLTAQTQGLIGAREFGLMKRTVFLINTARGPIIDQAALTRALASGVIQGAALDVFEQEPTTPGDPLLSMEQVILAPHAVAWTYELFRDIGHDCVKAICAVARGEAPRYVVNTEVLNRPGLQEKLTRCKINWDNR